MSVALCLGAIGIGWAGVTEDNVQKIHLRHQATSAGRTACVVHAVAQATNAHEVYLHMLSYVVCASHLA